MEPASSIVAKFARVGEDGKSITGEQVVSQITGTAYTAPYRWQHPRAKGGTGGLIPQKHHRALLDAAKARNIVLRAEEFLALANDGEDAGEPAEAAA